MCTVTKYSYFNKKYFLLYAYIFLKHKNVIVNVMAVKIVYVRGRKRAESWRLMMAAGGIEVG